MHTFPLTNLKIQISCKVETCNTDIALNIKTISDIINLVIELTLTSLTLYIYNPWDRHLVNFPHDSWLRKSKWISKWVIYTSAGGTIVGLFNFKWCLHPLLSSAVPKAMRSVKVIVKHKSSVFSKLTKVKIYYSN